MYKILQCYKSNSSTLVLISCGMQRKVEVYIWITFKPFILNKTFDFEEQELDFKYILNSSLNMRILVFFTNIIISICSD